MATFLRLPPFLSARPLFLLLLVALIFFDLVVFVYLLEHGRIRLLIQDAGAEVNDLLSPHLNGSPERKFTCERIGQKHGHVQLGRNFLPGSHCVGQDLAVVIRAHKEIPVQEIVKIMDALKAAEITRVGIVTKPEK